MIAFKKFETFIIKFLLITFLFFKIVSGDYASNKSDNTSSEKISEVFRSATVKNPECDTNQTSKLTQNGYF